MKRDKLIGAATLLLLMLFAPTEASNASARRCDPHCQLKISGCRVLRELERPPHDRLQERTITSASKAEADAQIEFEVLDEMQVDGRHDEMLLTIEARQRPQSAHVTVVFDRGRDPAAEIVLDFSGR